MLADMGYAGELGNNFYPSTLQMYERAYALSCHFPPMSQGIHGYHDAVISQQTTKYHFADSSDLCYDNDAPYLWRALMGIGKAHFEAKRVERAQSAFLTAYYAAAENKANIVVALHDQRKALLALANTMKSAISIKGRVFSRHQILDHVIALTNESENKDDAERAKLLRLNVSPFMIEMLLTFESDFREEYETGYPSLERVKAYGSLIQYLNPEDIQSLSRALEILRNPLEDDGNDDLRDDVDPRLNVNTAINEFMMSKRKSLTLFEQLMVACEVE